MNAVMTDAEIESAYDRDGYLVARNIIGTHDLEPVRAVISRDVDEFAREMLAKGKITSLHEQEPFERRYAAICRELSISPRNWRGRIFGSEFYDLYNHPEILRVIRLIIGPEVIQCGADNIRTKLPGAKITSFPWHQDSHYYNEPERGTWDPIDERAHIVSVWVPLVESTIDNGCLWVLPGSHRWGLMQGARGEDNNVRTVMDVEQKGTATPVPMQVGDVVFMTHLTFHRSTLNRTDASRWSIDFRYHTTPGSPPFATPELAALAHFNDQLRETGREPLVVLTEGHKPTWEEWRDATEARQARIKAR